MHGCGNDYVYLDAVSDPGLLKLDLPALSRAVSPRHTGIGSDGLIVVAPAESGVSADVRMIMFNADGSQSATCGNGLRCVAKLAGDVLGLRRDPLRIQTGAGVAVVERTFANGLVTHATVDMGVPTTELERIPALATKLRTTKTPATVVLSVDGVDVEATLVSMGNPHAVVFVPRDGLIDGGAAMNDEACAALNALVGPVVERHRAFLQRTNMHIVRVNNRTHARLWSWERGSGPTLACGSGACAVLVAGVLTGRLEREAEIDLPGGRLTIRWDEHDGRVRMHGPCVEVYRGVWPIG